ncbi:hypothetical protein I317_04474 [Kwoniella heveanensis CBS 569]|nr:hypothetical protein I317_04474 [Kwoniella heveanensis CBS 569]
MTWIFCTDSSYPYWVPHKPIDYAFGHNHVKTITSDELLFLGNLVASCPRDSTHNTVNAGSIHPDMLNLSATDSDVILEQGVISGPKNAIAYDIIERALKYQMENRITEVVRNGTRSFVRRKGEEKMKLEKIEDGFKRTKWVDMKTYLSENEWTGEFSYEEAMRWMKEK